MSVSTMIMAPAVEHASSSSCSPSSQSSSEHGPDNMLPLAMRSHSRSQQPDGSPDFEVPSFDTSFELDISFKSDDPITAPGTSAPTETNDQQIPAKPLRRPSLARQRTSSLIERSKSWFPSPKMPKDASPNQLQRPSTSFGEATQSDGSPKKPDAKQADRGLSRSDSFASFAKRSWIASSRSPSPRDRSASMAERAPVADWVDVNITNKLTRGRRPSESVADVNVVPPTPPPETESPKPPPKALSRASSYLAKLKPSSSVSLSKLVTNQESDNSCASSVSSHRPPPSISIETSTSQSTSCESNAAAPNKSSDEMPDRTRDALWSSLKALDIELVKFMSKQPGLRMQQVHTQLLPFLRGTMNHSSNKYLQPDMIDNRTVILGKWWQAILDMLEGHGQHPLSAADRTTALEAATLIMMRTEWRQATTRFQPLVDRAPHLGGRFRSSTTSSRSSESSGQADFFADSAEHNVRTTFVSHLMRQIAFVVDKMSLRHVPPHMVNFAGKTCAYAFFFAPGVADVLVRLWGLTSHLITRAADELKLPRSGGGGGGDNERSAVFPPGLESLAWVSSTAMWKTLKQIPELSLLVARVPWTGPWVSRWKGRDSDLFFIFCKYFHILTEEFVPEGSTLAEKAESPGFVLVQAQLLSLLDTTIHRQSSAAGPFGSPLLGSLQNPDAAAAAAAMALPLPSSNMMRGMSENRLLVLLKDFLSDTFSGTMRARHTFAETLAAMLKAATKKISQFDSPACFVLFDLLEEALPIYSEFEPLDDSTTYIDWDFWFDVCKRILNSLNTMSEIRLFSFIFTIWGPVTKNARRKRKLCLEWLLTEDTFNTYFSHWCPMVRAYYHRLLCWRVCRDEGGADFGDGKIYVTVATRLRTAWGQYLFLKEQAHRAGRFPPSSAPMMPSPGKKLMIIRQEQNPSHAGLMVGFDSFAKFSGKEEAYENPFIDGEAAAKADTKKRWSIFGRVLSLSGGDSSLVSSSDKNASDDELQIARRETARMRQAPPPPPAPKTSMFGNQSNRTDFESLHSPTLFDEPKFVFKFTLGWSQQMPIRDRVLTRPLLPRPAQTKARLRSRSDSPPPSPKDLPAPTRTVSGGSHHGLVNDAKNASPLSSPERGRGREAPDGCMACHANQSQHHASDRESSSGSGSDGDAAVSDSSRDNQGQTSDSTMTRPIRPTGLAAKNAAYVGRALAEWGLVVYDCDSFVDRRRDEGVVNLSEVEVPSLSLEGFRKLAG